MNDRLARLQSIWTSFDTLFMLPNWAEWTSDDFFIAGIEMMNSALRVEASPLACYKVPPGSRLRILMEQGACLRKLLYVRMNQIMDKPLI